MNDTVEATITATDGAVIAYSDEGAGAPVVLLPGLCCSKRWWEPQRTELARTHRVISVDFRSVGNSPPTRQGHRVARYAMDVAELLAQTALEDVVLVGWSLGASVCLALIELTGQERLAGVVLVESSPKLVNDESWQFGIGSLAEVAAIAESLRYDHARATESLTRLVVAEPAREPSFAQLLTDVKRTDPQATAQLFWDHANQDWRDVLNRIQVPTLVVAGTASRMLTPGVAEHVASLIPGARLELIEGASHAPFRDQTSVFNVVLSRFIDDCQERPSD